MINFCLLLLLAFVAAPANASGPVVPRGWNGFYEPVLSNGESCCMPADLNGTGLVGGAFVLISDNKKPVRRFRPDLHAAARRTLASAGEAPDE